MSIAAVLAPVFVQMAMTFVLLFWMGGLRGRALAGGAVRPADIALGERA